jgi:glycosyltransferase involved in cell wall biosynthesis
MSGPAPEVVLDLSRLLSRVLHPTPTGVDRCEMAYARGLMAAIPDRLRFAAVHPTGVYGRLPANAVAEFLDATEYRWQAHGRVVTRSLRSQAAEALLRLRPRAARRTAGRRIYVQASPNNLTKPDLVAAILRREKARFVCLLHDLIPIQYPEYARPGGAALHRRRIDTLVALADGVIANSQATLAAFQPYAAAAGRTPELRVAHLGTDDILRPVVRATVERPYFVCVGTIEPRKNHLLLLHLWRSMAEERGAEAVSRLLVVGRRGWENEQVVDMLERCPALEGCVEEYGGLPDGEVQTLIAGARGLLLPSFAEGYGMPVTEALSLGVPVLCSDLPALREAGGGVPTFLDPLDGPGWRAAIDDLARPDSVIAAEQRARLAGWQAPRWEQHIAILLDLLHKLGA